MSFLYDKNIKAYNLATRSSEDLESGVGKWLYTYVSNEIKDPKKFKLYL